MPGLIGIIAERLATKQLDLKNQSVGTSIFGKIKSMDPMSIGDTLKFVKTQKKDTLYELRIHTKAFLL